MQIYIFKCCSTTFGIDPELIYLKNKELQAKKMGQKSFLKISSHYGSLMVQMLTSFVADLRRLADSKRKMDEMDELGTMLKS